jgi:hypothetical protein
MDLSPEARAANLRACTAPPRQVTPAESKLRAQLDRGIITRAEYIDGLNRLPQLGGIRELLRP